MPVRPFVLAPGQRDAMPAASSAVHHPACGPLVNAGFAGIEVITTQFTAPAQARRDAGQLLIEHDVLPFRLVRRTKPGPGLPIQEADSEAEGAPPTAMAGVQKHHGFSFGCAAR